MPHSDAELHPPLRPTNVDTHGRRLYFVIAKDCNTSLSRNGRTPAAVGHGVVKKA